jgi:molybdate/tungstate transport system permease protein
MFPTRSRTEPARDWLTVAFLLGGLLLCYYLLPLAALLVARPPGDVLARLSDPGIVAAVTNSLASASASTALATAFGLPLAYWLARTETRWRSLVVAVVVLPLVLPPVVSGLVLLTLVGPNSPVGAAAAVAGIPLTRSLAGVILAQTFVASPFVVVTAKAAFEGVDDRLEEAAATLGESRTAAFRRVTLPLAWPGVLAGVTLAFARSMGEFGATMMLAYYPRTMPVQIWVSFTTRGVAEAFPVALVLVGVSIAALATLNAVGTNPWD